METRMEWTKRDDTSHTFTMGGVLLVGIVYETMGTPGWKVQVANRSLRDKIQSEDDAKKVAVAFAQKILSQCQKELDEVKTKMGMEDTAG